MSDHSAISLEVDACIQCVHSYSRGKDAYCGASELRIGTWEEWHEQFCNPPAWCPGAEYGDVGQYPATGDKD